MSRTERMFLVIVMAAAVSWLVFLLLRVDPIVIEDDAFIAFRYAQNFARGAGLVFNVGERHWGFTSPLHTLMLGVAGAVSLDIVRTALVAGIVAGFGAAALVGLTLRPLLGVYGSTFVAASLLVSARSLWYPGLETALLLFFLAATLWSFRNQRFTAAALAGAAACLTRPDALVFVLPLFAAYRGAWRLRTIGTFVLPGLAWLVFAYFYFGDVLPLTFGSKKGSEAFGPYFVENIVWVVSFFQNLWYVKSVPGAVVSASCVAGVLLVRSVRRDRALVLTLLGAPLVLVLLYAKIGPPVMHRWEIVSAAYFLHAAGLVTVVVVCRTLLAHTDGITRRMVFAVVGIFAALALGLSVFTSNEQIVRSAPNAFWKGARHRSFLAAAQWMREHWPAGAYVASQEVGTLAYYSDARFWDRFFLVRPRNSSYSPPPYLVAWTEAATVEDFGRVYRRVHLVPRGQFGPVGLFASDERP